MNTKGLTDFFEKNWKPIAGAVVLAALVVGGAGIWKERQRSQEQAAAELFYELQKGAKGKEGTAAEQAMQPLLANYPKSRAAYEATLQMGDMWMEQQKYPEAVQRYQQASEMAKDPFSRILARYNLGIAQEAAGKYQEAVTSYGDALATKGSDFLQPEIMLAQARCYEALQQAAKALELYKEIQAKFANRGSYYTGVASALANRLSASAPSGQGSGQ